MSSSNQELGVLYRAIGAVLETLAYGVYTALIPVSTYLMISKGLKGSTARKVLLSLTLSMYAISTLHWVSSVQRLVKTMNTLVVFDQPIIELPTCGTSGCYLVLLHSLALVNYIITDGVVVWRAWVLCQEDSRKLLIASLVLLGISWASVFSVAVIRITITVIVGSGGTPNRALTFGIDVTQVLTLVMSLATNALATGIIGAKAWRYRRWMTGIQQGSGGRADKIMTIVMESGVVYCLSGLITLISLFIRLPSGTLGTIYQPVNVHIAGIYPVVVVVLVNQRRSLDNTAFASSSSSAYTSDTSRQIGSWKVASRPPDQAFSSSDTDTRAYELRSIDGTLQHNFSRMPQKSTLSFS